MGDYYITFLRTNTEFHREVTEIHRVKKISVDLCDPSVDLRVTKSYKLDIPIFHYGWQTLLQMEWTRSLISQLKIKENIWSNNKINIKT